MSAPDPALISALAGMQDSYEKATTGYGDPLDGIEDDDYQARVESWDLFPGKKKPDALYLKMVGSIQNHAEHTGRPIDFLFEITDPDKLGFLKDHFFALGVTDLDMTQLAPGSDLLNDLLDVPILIGIYTNKKGYRNAVVRQRLDGEQHSDLGTTSQQTAMFEQNVSNPSELDKINKTIEKNFKNKPEGCICKDPTQGDFDENCQIPGHGIGF